MISALIVEDEPQAAHRLESLIGEINSEIKVLAKLDSVKQCVKWVTENPLPSLIFLDIQLGDGISFDIFDKVEISCPVIFTTAYNEYALKAFKVNSIDYLLKPIDKQELKTAIDKFKKFGPGSDGSKMMESISSAMAMLTKKYKARFVIKVGEHLRYIETSEILFFFSLEKTTFAQTRDGRKHIVDYTMEQLEGILDPARFFRISRKYTVASDSIQDMISFTNSRLRLVLKTSDDKDIIVARERVQEFKGWLDR
jgi:DNA-binding LytR/AlgR family response regulator